MGRARPFDDFLSLLHFSAALVSALLGVDVSATIAYVFYQLLERERLGRKLGDLVEWLVGLLAGAAARYAVTVVMRSPC